MSLKESLLGSRWGKLNLKWPRKFLQNFGENVDKTFVKNASKIFAKISPRLSTKIFAKMRAKTFAKMKAKQFQKYPQKHLRIKFIFVELSLSLFVAQLQKVQSQHKFSV